MPKRKRLSCILFENASLSLIDAHYEPAFQAGATIIKLVKSAIRIFFSHKDDTRTMQNLRDAYWAEFKRGMLSELTNGIE